MDLDEFLNKETATLTKPTEEPKEAAPYIKISGDRIDRDRGGIELTLDWNEEFVEYLRVQGYNGTSDELVIQKYLQVLYADISSRIKDNNDDDYQ